MSLFQRITAAAHAFGSPDGALRAESNVPSGTGRPDGWLTRAFGGGKSVSGQSVTPDSALRVMAVYSATRILAESMASLPINVLQAEGSKRNKVAEHPLSTLLHVSPNTNNTAFEFVEMEQAHLALRGNAYSWIDWSGKGEVQGLYPLHPDKVVARYDKAARKFTYDLDGVTGVPAHHVLHIRGFSLDGLVGLSPVALARETLGLAMAAEQVGSEAFSDGFVPPVVLEVAEKADKAQRETYRSQWTDLIRARRSGPPVISGGMKLHSLRVSMADMQFIEARKFSIVEIARMFRIPPHMLADLERATHSNIEQLSLEFVKYTLAPWIVRWEQRLNLTLLSDDERRRGLYVKFNVDALLRGDIKSRYEAYRIGLEGRILNANDCREKEDLDGYSGGDEFWAPLNMAPVSVSREKGGAAQ